MLSALKINIVVFLSLFVLTGDLLGTDLSQANIAFEAKDYLTTVAICSKIIVEQQENYEAYLLRGKANFHLAYYDKALKDLGTSIRDENLSVDIYEYAG